MIIHKWKKFNKVANVPSSGCPNTFTSRSDREETAKETPGDTFQTLQTPVRMLNIKVPDSTGIKKQICLEGLPGGNLFSLKELDSTVKVSKAVSE